MQAPATQVSFVVQALPSLHGREVFMWTHPVAGLHESSVHMFPSSQPSGGPLMQTPPPHASFVVHSLPSLQGSVLFAFRQPLAGLQESSVQRFPSSQFGAGPPTQKPPLQMSPVVQAEPSLQDWVFGAWTQPVAGLQVSSVQGLPSLQFGGTAGLQTLLTQVSAPLQAFPSLQSAPVVQPPVMVNCTVSLGRWLCVPYSLDPT